MVEIKNAISFDEYMTIVNNVSNSCFPDDTYSPAYYELMLRYSLIKVFTPDYDMPDFTAESYNEVWEKVTNSEANEIMYKIRQSSYYFSIDEAIDNAINYRIKMLTSSPMSMSDLALASLINTFNEKMNNIPEFSKETVENIANTMANSKGNLAKDMFNVMVDEGMLAKPNRATRRKNGQRSAKAKTATVKEDEE